LNFALCVVSACGILKPAAFRSSGAAVKASLPVERIFGFVSALLEAFTFLYKFLYKKQTYLRRKMGAARKIGTNRNLGKLRLGKQRE
jgi:hypothetical protein